MSGRKIFFSPYLVGAIFGFLSGLLYFYFEGVYNFRQYIVTLEWAKSSISEFEGDVMRIIGNRAYLNRTLFKNNEIRNETVGFEKCFISSPEGSAHLIPVNDPLFQDKTTSTETLYPNGEFVRVSPILMTAKNFEDCISCH